MIDKLQNKKAKQSVCFDQIDYACSENKLASEDDCTEPSRTISADFNNPVQQAAARACFLALRRTPREDLRWITVIISARVLDAHNEEAEVAALVEASKRFQSDWRSVVMRHGHVGRSGTRWAGVIEIDLLHPCLLGGKRKQTLLSDVLGIRSNVSRSQRVAVLHAHLVLDGRGHVERRLMSDLRTQWPGAWRIVAKPIHTTGTISSNLERLAEYSTKHRCRYAEAWQGRPTKFYAGAYEPVWRSRIEAVYAGLRSDMVFASVRSRAGTRLPKCSGGNGQAAEMFGKIDSVRPMQLMDNKSYGQHTTDEEPLPLIRELMYRIMRKNNEDFRTNTNLHYSQKTTSFIQQAIASEQDCNDAPQDRLPEPSNDGAADAPHDERNHRPPTNPSADAEKGRARQAAGSEGG